jgi:hypothetical protein
MRVFIVKKGSDLPELLRSAPAALQQLRALNPHLDLSRLTPGSVLLVPGDGAPLGAAAAAALPPAGQALADFASLAGDALKAAQQAVREAAAARQTDDAAVNAALASEAVVALLARDAELQAQASAAVAGAQQDAKKAATDLKTLAVLAQAVQDELSALGKQLAA